MSEMVERVARAIAESDSGDPAWEIYVPEARAAIAAMREPTRAMIEADPDDDGEWNKINSAACAKAFWQAMIDEALK